MIPLTSLCATHQEFNGPRARPCRPDSSVILWSQLSIHDEPQHSSSILRPHNQTSTLPSMTATVKQSPSANLSFPRAERLRVQAINLLFSVGKYCIITTGELKQTHQTTTLSIHSKHKSHVEPDEFRQPSHGQAYSTNGTERKNN